MKRDKKITQLAKKLVEFSKDESGAVSEAKVGEVLAGLKQVELRNPLATLKAYLSYIRREIALQTAVVSTPAGLSEESLKAIETKYSAVYGRPISAVTREDASLIAGVRVRVGDDVYDASVAGRLQRLAENVH
ncbi:F0F1 ATP synthase subunit delta [Coraliomargarita sp. SDUM461003]|uniref:F0F1 ATP synthase subunit delta n=1 Tax=Thalassobacterium maritimum TaxID=3041265 RepID=A0ABU1B090_9BACT|nr:F0F1 ATP synthase subunit delta [Coraliomargarita sp. SDUM461003]MDQ8208790.1 F0F1 ATP synthase subunit delta [Coraliomargarita sp. SDUM461003]